MEKIDLVCIVDDDPVHVFLTRKYIELSGYVDKILICKNGKDAFDTLKKLIADEQAMPRIIFLDLNMPIWDGWQFLEEFTAIPVQEIITIYILTSSNSEEDFQKAKQFSLKNNYLIKPVNQNQIKDILADYIKRN